MNFRRLSPLRILALVLMLAGMAAAGTVGFVLLEGQDPMLAFLTTVNLLSTVGMGEMPASVGGRILAVLIIVVGVGTLLYVLTTVADFLIGGYLAEILGERSMKKKISSISDHYIICGFGRVGSQVAREFARAGEEFVVIDNHDESLAACAEAGYLHLKGDAADDEILRRAGILEARGLAACVDTDADNVFVTLTARVLAPDIQIVARANSEDTRNKLERPAPTRWSRPMPSAAAKWPR